MRPLLGITKEGSHDVTAVPITAGRPESCPDTLNSTSAPFWMNSYVSTASALPAASAPAAEKASAAPRRKSLSWRFAEITIFTKNLIQLYLAVRFSGGGVPVSRVAGFRVPGLAEMLQAGGPARLPVVHDAGGSGQGAAHRTVCTPLRSEGGGCQPRCRRPSLPHRPAPEDGRLTGESVAGNPEIVGADRRALALQGRGLHGVVTADRGPSG